MGVLLLAVAVAIGRFQVADCREHARDGKADLAAAAGRAASSAGEDSAADRMYYYRLAFCVVGLNITMLLWGIGQEFIMTNQYVDEFGIGWKMPSSSLVVLCNRAATVIFSASILCVQGQSLYFPGYLEGAAPAVTNAIASWCQYQALLYVSFALQTSAKSAKLLPVLLLSVVRGEPRSLHDFVEAAVICTSLVIFGLETEGGDDGSDSSATGILLLGVFVIFDAMTPHLQDMLFKRYPAMNSLQSTLAMASSATVLLLVELVVAGEISECLRFLQQFPHALVHLSIISLASATTQAMISFTIKHFGPVVFTIIACTRQLISIMLSTVLFGHACSATAAVACLVIFATLMIRAVRPSSLLPEQLRLVSEDTPEGGRTAPRVPVSNTAQITRWLGSSVGRVLESPLVLFCLAIHVFYGVYALAQEFLTAHTFSGEVFQYPLFLVAVTHSAGALLGYVTLRSRGEPVFVKELKLTALPAVSNLISTWLQHRALYSMFFPAQTLMKTLKILPLMLLGRVLKNRSYSVFDYAEGTLITFLTAFFVWSFQFENEKYDISSAALVGVFFMIGYIVVDPLTNNLEDLVYQSVHIDPAHMLVGMEMISAVMAWIVVALDGEFGNALRFISMHSSVIVYLALLAGAASFGAMTCQLTVRVFGPAVFTLLMMSRQVMSMLISVLIYQHTISVASFISLLFVAILLIASSARRVHTDASSVEEASGGRCESAAASETGKLDGPLFRAP